jgi:ribonuclease P protein component
VTKVSKPATFPRRARLLTPSAYTAVFEKRNARRGRFFHLHLGGSTTAPEQDLSIAEPGQLQIARLGIAVPKKLLKTAAHRNLVKRLAREVFRQQRNQLENQDYVLRLAVKLDPKRQVLDRQALAEDIGRLFAARTGRAKPSIDQAAANQVPSVKGAAC